LLLLVPTATHQTSKQPTTTTTAVVILFPTTDFPCRHSKNKTHRVNLGAAFFFLEDTYVKRAPATAPPSADLPLLLLL
jgi:hypothetical protein